MSVSRVKTYVKLKSVWLRTDFACYHETTSNFSPICIPGYRHVLACSAQFLFSCWRLRFIFTRFRIIFNLLVLISRSVQLRLIPSTHWPTTLLLNRMFAEHFKMRWCLSLCSDTHCKTSGSGDVVSRDCAIRTFSACISKNTVVFIRDTDTNVSMRLYWQQLGLYTDLIALFMEAQKRPPVFLCKALGKG
jgi:hypothetical protein